MHDSFGACMLQGCGAGWVGQGASSRLVRSA
jgi:hypothetical protein